MLTSYLAAFRTFNRNTLLHFVAISVIGFTVDGGIYSVVFNLFLLRLGYAPDFVGQVNSAGLLTFALCSLPAGALGSRWGNRLSMIWGLGIMMISSVLLALAEFTPEPIRPGWLMGTYMLSFLGVAIYFVNTAPFLMSITTSEQRNYAFSIQSAMIALAAFVGSVVGGILPSLFAIWHGLSLDSATPYRYPLLLAALTVNVGILALVFTSEERPLPVPSQPRRTYASLFRVPRFRAINLRQIGQGFIWLLVVISIIRILQISGMAVTMTFFNVYMDERLGAPTAQIGLLAGLGRLLAVPIVLSMPMLSARWGNQKLVILSSLSAALGLLPLALVPIWWIAGFGYMGVMAGSSIRYTAFMIFSMELVKPEQRTIMSGVSEMTAGLSFALMALLGGYIIVEQGYSTLFLLGLLFTLIGTGLFWGYFGSGKSASRSLNPQGEGAA